MNSLENILQDYSFLKKDESIDSKSGNIAYGKLTDLLNDIGNLINDSHLTYSIIEKLDEIMNEKY